MIIVITKHLFDANIIKNKISMVETICVRGPTLARWAMFWYVEPAVNRQPGFRRELVEQNQQLHTIIDIPSSEVPQI